jgi:hypothetical protein
VVLLGGVVWVKALKLSVLERTLEEEIVTVGRALGAKRCSEERNAWASATGAGLGKLILSQVERYHWERRKSSWLEMSLHS